MSIRIPRPYRTDGSARGRQSVPERAREAVEMIAKGASRRDVAEHFGVTMRTVDAWRIAVVEATEPGFH
jgi:transposase